MSEKKQQVSARQKGVALVRRLIPIGLGILVTFLVAVCGVFGALYLVVHGPSVGARNLFIGTLVETSRGPAIARWFLSEAEIAEITAGMRSDVEANINEDLIQLPDTEVELPDRTSEVPITSEEASDVSPDEDDGLELIDIQGGAYKGKLLIVEDPKRVLVATHDRYGTGKRGLTLEEFIETYNGVAGTNAGGFYDPGGQGNGGTPMGLVIEEGKIVWGSASSRYSICGFDDSGLLYVGTMTGKQALNKGITSACSFGPALIMNGEPCIESGSYGNGRNPRTAIGQRADGAILMLVIEGRQLDSLGATYDDLVDIFMEYGAVNATNLDGGSSSAMIVDGEQVIRPSTIAASSRGGATAIVVR